MQALYDSHARAIAIQLTGDARQDQTHEVVSGAIVGLRDGLPVEVELLAVGGPDDGARLAQVAARYGLDLQALSASLQAAVAAPDRPVTVDVGARSAA